MFEDWRGPLWWQEAGLVFIWPILLWLLLLVPMGLVAYRLMRQRRGFEFWGFSSGILVLVGLVLLISAIARPQMQVSTPSRADRLMVVLDISGSMRADDVAPSRFDAAKITINELLGQQPANLRVGLVTTAATATLVQTPTTDREALKAAIDGISLQTGSALGSGLLIGLSELLPSAGIDVQQIMNASINRNDTSGTPEWQPDPEKTALPGSNRAVAMVLISDGESNVGPSAMAMAELAAQFGVRIHTVGIGTSQGAVVKAEGISQRVRLDEALLTEIAQTTIGQSHLGATPEDWRAIYEAIDASIQFDQRHPIEISAPLTGLGLLLVLTGMAIRLLRQGRIL
jgi:Ca-activated chloride channel family protein